jgi:voltage-gated potassium channel Kch
MPQGQGIDLSHFSYYSYVTLTTLGYGDITPISTQARSLALLEAIMGPLYLAILVARLVGIHIAQGVSRGKS